MITDDNEDEEQLLEPFYEQKMSCHRVINYLECIRPHMETTNRFPNLDSSTSTAVTFCHSVEESDGK